MVKKFTDFIQKNNLFESTDSVLLTISGGVDSVVMAELFSEAGFKFGIAHCNFQLRDDDSNQDALFVENMAKSFNAPFHLKNFDTKNIHEQGGESVQMVARKLRYAWFEELSEEYSYEYIATAHHQNDSIESLLLSLIRGTGVNGLKGIPLKRGKIIRPMMAFTKNEIMGHAKEINLGWREDRSNLKNEYRRNFIRNKVLPLVQQINPNYEQTFQATIQRLDASALVWNNYVKSTKEKAFRISNNQIEIIISSFDTETENLSVSLLADCLKEYDFSFFQSKKIWEQRNSTSGLRYYSKSHILYKDRNSWFLKNNLSSEGEVFYVDIEEQEVMIQNQVIEFKIVDSADNVINTDPSFACVDFSKLHFPLEIRTWVKGDYFYPLGMAHKKKISNFLIDKKVPLIVKDKVMVVLSQDQIVWVVGLRMDDRFKINEQSMKTFIMNIKNIDVN